MAIKIDDNIDFLLWELGETIKHNGIDKKVLIEDYAEKINEYDYKIIITDFEIQQGDLIEYKNAKWIVISEIDKNIKTYKARIRKCFHGIKMYVDEGKLIEFNSIIDTKIFDVEQGQYVNLAIGKLQLTIQANEFTNKIKLDDRFIKMNSAWKVVGIDLSKIGLIILNCEKIGFNNATDNIELEIANFWNYNKIHDYDMEISESNIFLNVGDTKQIDVIIKDTVDNITTTIVNPILTYTSGDESIIKVDNNGLITTYGEGNTNITIKFVGENNITVIKEVNVNVIVSTVALPLTITASNGLDSISWGLKNTFTASNAIGNVTWNLTDESGNPTTLATIISTSGNNCTVEANHDRNSGYVLLNCEDSNGNKASFRIRIKSLWV